MFGLSLFATTLLEVIIAGNFTTTMTFSLFLIADLFRYDVFECVHIVDD